MINALIRDFGFGKADAQACYTIFMKNVDEQSIYDDIQGKRYLRIDKLGLVSPTEQVSEESQTQVDRSEQEYVETPKSSQIPKQIFIAHGKNNKPLEQLQKILNKFNVPFKVAVEEPNKGRPVSAKVAELMKGCTSGIFIFTADEETQDKDGNTLFRPSDNVVYELGAASVLYGNKIVIFKEDCVSFASDFSDIGYIPFEKDKLDMKAADLMLELIELGFMQLTPT